MTAREVTFIALAGLGLLGCVDKSHTNIAKIAELRSPEGFCPDFLLDDTLCDAVVGGECTREASGDTCYCRSIGRDGLGVVTCEPGGEPECPTSGDACPRGAEQTCEDGTYCICLRGLGPSYQWLCTEESPDGGTPDGGPDGCVPEEETCNGLDDDCDGEVDEGEAVDLGCAAEQVCAGGACCTIPETIEMLDVLFMVDNSGSMYEEHGLLGGSLPMFVRGLVTGDYNGDGTTDGRPVESLHVGVISSDMGTTYPVPTCENQPWADDGVLINESRLLPSGCAASYPTRYFTFEPGSLSGAELTTASNAFAADVNCVAQLGTLGCGYEQQLDAVLKALVPSDSGYMFEQATVGHGDGTNVGFVREGAALAVIMLTDEDDCSTTNRELYAHTSPTFTSVENLRCYYYPEVLQPLTRYSEGLLSLGVAPESLVFGLITGIPPEVDEESYATILAYPAMQEQVNPADPVELLPACGGTHRRAYPARRLVGVAELLEEAGAHTVARSICRDDYSEVIPAILEAVGQTVVPTTCG